MKRHCILLQENEAIFKRKKTMFWTKFSQNCILAALLAVELHFAYDVKRIKFLYKNIVISKKNTFRDFRVNFHEKKHFCLFLHY